MGTRGHVNQRKRSSISRSLVGALQQCGKRERERAAASNAAGNRAYAQGRLDQAESSYLLAVHHDPSYTDAHFNLGNVRYTQGDYVGALECYGRALTTGTPQADLYTSMGVTHVALNDLVNAKLCLLKALEFDAQYPEAFYNLGNVLTKEREYALAVKCFESAIAHRPAYVQAHHNLGGAQQQLGDLKAATESYMRALRLAPSDREVLINLADTLALQGSSEGLFLYEKLIAEQAMSADAHWNASTAFLLHGDYVRGWQEYEWRWKSKHFPSVKPDLPSTEWSGEALEGASIIVYSEQGFGDTLQFARYIPLLADRGARVYFQVPGALKRLMTRVPGIVEIFGTDEALPEADYHCALMSLPLLFQTTIETIPLPSDFGSSGLLASSVRKDDSRITVGLVWAGNPKHQYDHLRSMSLADFLPLAKVDGVDFVSLQKGAPALELSKVAFPGGIRDACAECIDFQDTADIVESLDLIIAVDTAVAHLAASMGKPVWLLLRNIPEWRWGLSSDSVAWYPTVRLFRKPLGTKWETLLHSVSLQLMAFVAEHSIVPRAQPRLTSHPK
jgi:tetratricopeptide (TPR) repeat protein